LERELAEFANDPAFARRPPSREHIARAWTFARFKKDELHERPTHDEVVGALKKMFPEYRSSRTNPTRSRPGQ
jgi:hypothetical protein